VADAMKAIATHGPHTRLASYLELCKPRVVALMVFTAIVGMLLASPGLVPWQPLLFGTLGIALAACSAAAINHVLDRRIDAQMRRTRHRPLPPELLEEVRPRVRVTRPYLAQRRATESVDSDIALKLGQRVRHSKYGEGVVLRYEGHGPHVRVQVNFERAGMKELLLALANLEAL